MTWRGQAACRDKDPELFFPVGPPYLNRIEVAAAKAVCRHCPVSGACLAWALASGEPDGICGGLTPAERRQLAVAAREERRTA